MGDNRHEWGTTSTNGGQSSQMGVKLHEWGQWPRKGDKLHEWGAIIMNGAPASTLFGESAPPWPRYTNG